MRSEGGMAATEPPILVLMYHAVASPEERIALPAEDLPYAVEARDFHAHLELLADRADMIEPGRAWAGPGGAPPDEDAPPRDSSQARVLLTFDDSLPHHADRAAPTLKAKNMEAVFFLTSDELDRPNRLSWSAARDLAAAGFAIGSHGKTHRFLQDLAPEALNEELTESRAVLEDRLGAPVMAVSFPGGRGGEREALAARAAGYRVVFGSRPGVWAGQSVAPRIAIRGGAKGERLLRRLLTEPEETLAALERNEWRKAWARRILGNRAYHWAYCAASAVNAWWPAQLPRPRERT